MKTNLNKSFFASKINWAAILLILASLIPLIEETDFAAMRLKDWITFAFGIAIIIIRTYFTNTISKEQ